MDDLKDLCDKAQHIFKIPKLDDEKIAKLDIPVMVFHFGDKVHRLDVTKALLGETIQQMMDQMGNQNEAEKRKDRAYTEVNIALPVALPVICGNFRLLPPEIDSNSN